MPSQYCDRAHTLGRDVISHIGKDKTSDGRVYYSGNVITPHGIVCVVFSEPSRGSWHHVTVMTFAHAGTYYHREWKRQFQPRYLANLARKFAADVVDGRSARQLEAK